MKLRHSGQTVWTLARRIMVLVTLGWASQMMPDAASAQAVDEGAKTPDASPVERTVYVPFSKLRDVFEREGRGVFLPYDQFEKLWQAAQTERETPSGGPPVDSIITAVISEATVEKDVVRVDASLTIELLKEGWNQIPLRLAEAAILSATIDGQVARVTPATDGGYQLLVENPGSEPKQIELRLVYARAFDKSPGMNRVAFSAPQAPINRWKIRIPQAGVKINVDPMIAATEELSSESSARNPAAGTAATEEFEQPPSPELTRVPQANESENVNSEEAASESAESFLLAFVGTAPQVAISWTPKAEGATGLDALISVQVQQEVFVAEGVVRTRASLAYDISRAQINRVSVEVPSDHKVVNVFDQNVRKWDVQVDGQIQRIDVELFEPASSSQSLSLELEKFYTTEAMQIDVAKIRALDVGRQLGIVVVQVDPALRAEANARTGLLQMDTGELSDVLKNQEWNFAFRYAALPFDLGLSVEKVQPKISVEQLVELQLAPEQISLQLTALYEIEEAGVFQLQVQIPTGFEIQQVVGKEVNGYSSVPIDAFFRAADAGTEPMADPNANPVADPNAAPIPDLNAAAYDGQRETLIINLGRKAIGKVGLLLRLQRRLDDANLQTPTGSTSEIAIPIPQARQANLRRASGNLVVAAPESLRITPTPSGLRTIALSEAGSIIPLTQVDLGGRSVLAYAFTEQPAALSLSAERRKPNVTSRQRMLVQVEEGVTKIEDLFITDIQYSGVASLRIDIPQDIADRVRNQSSSLRDAVMSPQPDDVPEGYVAWEFTGETELLGRQVIQLSWETKSGDLAVGSSTQIQVPRLIAAGTNRAWGQIVITKSETLDVEPTGQLDGLRPIDPILDVMSDARVPNAAWALEFYDDWSLALQATRYQLEEVKRTSIERGLARVVATRSGSHSVQILYRIRSARQRLAVMLPAGTEFDSQPVRVNGSAVTLERGDQNVFTIPLIGQDPKNAFVLDLRYSLPGDYQSFSLPEFPEDPAVQRVYLGVYLPVEIRLLHSAGPWTEEFTWGWRNSKLAARQNKTESDLVKWIAEGINASNGPPFQTDGQLLLYSALRPDPPPQGSLRLTTTNERTLAALVLGICALVGLLFLRTSVGIKLAAISALLIAAVACGVFAPTLGQQLMGTPMIAGLLTIGIGWAGWHAFQSYESLDWSRWLSAPLRGGVNSDGVSRSEAPDFEEARVGEQPSPIELDSVNDDSASDIDGARDIDNARDRESDNEKKEGGKDDA